MNSQEDSTVRELEAAGHMASAFRYQGMTGSETCQSSRRARTQGATSGGKPHLLTVSTPAPKPSVCAHGSLWRALIPSSAQHVLAVRTLISLIKQLHEHVLIPDAGCGAAPGCSHPLTMIV